jgi:hypothetical protein
MKLDFRRLLVYFIALYTIFSLFSCEKDEIVGCDIIVGGFSEYNPIADRTFYYFRVESGGKVRVDELTYYSFRVGDEICQ